MRLFFKRWLNDKWVLLGFVIIVFGGFFFVTIGQGGTTDKPQGNTYNESLTIGATAGAGHPAKPEPPKSEPTKPEPSKPQGKTYDESLNLAVKAAFRAEAEVIKKTVEKTVVIGIYFLLITVALQIVALKPPCSRKIQICIGIFVLLTAYLLFQADWFRHFISKLFGL